MNAFNKLLDFLIKLESHKIHYSLEHNRGEAVMVLIAVPGERWEAEFFGDSHVEVEVFASVATRGPARGLEGEEALDRLFQSA
ncbi:MAG: hypothetical protein H0T45_07140 [Pyrinomonadaceae bacterium]|nr:hypothetical protein [Pyrinomonadaceae bacterium]